LTLDAVGSWTSLDGSDVDVTGRLIGGCIETISHLAGTPYGDVAAYGRAHADEGLLVYLEAAEHGAYDICRALHGLRLAGWFEHASAVLLGRTSAPDAEGMTQAEAVADALGGVGVPVVLDVECGHVQPSMPLVNGARALLVLDGERRELTQQLA
jgi:muramoyltetrapeptide carboxypeptidase LdcA involved in peptidoglycan recycling